MSGGNIGSATESLDTTINVLSATAGGLISVDETAAVVIDAVTVTISRVSDTGEVADVVDAAQSDLTAVGAILLSSTAGDITINDGDTDGLGLSSGGVTRVIAESGSVLINSGVKATNAISISAADDVTQAAAGDITSTSGTIDVLAVSGAISMNDGAVTATTDKDIRLVAGTDVTLGSLTAGTGSVSVIAG